MRLFDNQNSRAGKMTVSVIIVGFAVFVLEFVFDMETERAQHIARAQLTGNATTSVNILNTPPTWTVDAQEAPESSTSSPTNATSTVSWAGTGTDSNGSDYFLIICKTNALPDANEGAPPTCDGGDANQWAISATTTSGVGATAATTTLEAWAELNDWWASICDIPAGIPTTARCNTDQQQGSGTTLSPFHVNHRPTFTSYINDGPVDPGAEITWTTVSADPDALSVDTVRVFICETAGFDFATPECDGGDANTLATSTLFASNPATTTTITIPMEDRTYNAYAWVLDNHNFAALEVGGPTTSDYIVNNVAPTVSSSNIFLNYGTDMILTNAGGETTGFTVTFVVTDNNSCVANASTTSEFNAASVSVFRTGVGSTSCDTAGEYDRNNCYNTDLSQSVWAYTPANSTSTDTCTGSSDATQAYEFNFPLWYHAEPTDGIDLTDSTWFNDSWSAAVEVSDDDLASSTNATSGTSVELTSLLAFELNTATIPYGSVSPGGTTTPMTAVTTIAATGNVGIDEGLEGEDMCIDYTTFDSCYDPSPTEATSTVLVGQQVYATSSIAYSSIDTTALSAVSTETEINVFKTTNDAATSTGDTYWGIAIPASIVLSGAYTGQNTFTVIKGEAQDWAP
jgi:hypothetical protein